jgi:NitT/TauT family transport system substrate-binding protein
VPVRRSILSSLRALAAAWYTSRVLRSRLLAGLGSLAVTPLVIAPRRASAATTIRIATLPLDGMALALYADTMGFFSKAGITVETHVMPNGASILAAITGGSIDIGASELTALAFAHARGLPLTLVYGGGIYNAENPTEDLVVRSSSSIAKASDLDGKVVGVLGLRGFTQYAPMFWVDQNGGTSSTLRCVELRPAEVPAALEDGRIDASLVAEPFIAAARPYTRHLAYACNAIAPKFLIAAYCAAPSWAAAHAAEVQAFQQAMRSTAVWANANPARTAQLPARGSHREPGGRPAAARVTHPTVLVPDMVQPLIDLTSKYGGIPRFSAADIIYHA